MENSIPGEKVILVGLVSLLFFLCLTCLKHILNIILLYNNRSSFFLIWTKLLYGILCVNVVGQILLLHFTKVNLAKHYSTVYKSRLYLTFVHGVKICQEANGDQV